jgi:hypothetical protein
MAPGTRVIQKLIIQNGWEGKGNHCCEVADRLTHSPELTHSDFHLFLHLKKHLVSQKVNKDQQIKSEVYTVVCR